MFSLKEPFKLEHFYMPLYHLKDNDFDISIMIKFAEEQKLAYAIAANLTIVEYIHNKSVWLCAE